MQAGISNTLGNGRSCYQRKNGKMSCALVCLQKRSLRMGSQNNVKSDWGVNQVHQWYPVHKTFEMLIGYLNITMMI